MPREIDAKESILIAASKLFQQQGYHATGLNQIIKESGCPKGSLYYYFPNGKEQLAVEAIARAKHQAVGEFKEYLAREEDAVKAIDIFLLENSQFDINAEYDGIPLALIALETSLISEPLRLACSDAYGAVRQLLLQKFLKSGWPREMAEEVCSFIFSMVQGSAVFAITELSNEPLITAHKQVMEYVRMKEKEMKELER